jgi:hypothetical protein
MHLEGWDFRIGHLPQRVQEGPPSPFLPQTPPIRCLPAQIPDEEPISPLLPQTHSIRHLPARIPDKEPLLSNQHETPIRRSALYNALRTPSPTTIDTMPRLNSFIHNTESHRYAQPVRPYEGIGLNFNNATDNDWGFHMFPTREPSPDTFSVASTFSPKGGSALAIVHGNVGKAIEQVQEA